MKGSSHGIVGIEQDHHGVMILGLSLNKAPFIKLFFQSVELIMHVRAWLMN